MSKAGASANSQMAGSSGAGTTISRTEMGNLPCSSGRSADWCLCSMFEGGATLSPEIAGMSPSHLTQGRASSSPANNRFGSSRSDAETANGGSWHEPAAAPVF